MKTSKLNIEDLGFQRHESKDLLLKLIDEKIENCKHAYISQWERDHSTTPALTEQKIAALQAKKAEIEAFFATSLSEKTEVDVQFSIELNAPEQTRERMYA